MGIFESAVRNDRTFVLELSNTIDEVSPNKIIHDMTLLMLALSLKRVVYAHY